VGEKKGHEGAETGIKRLKVRLSHLREGKDKEEE